MKMKIRPNVPIATQFTCYQPGQEYEIEEREAKLLIKAGQAVAVVDPAAAFAGARGPLKADKPTGTPVEKIVPSIEATDDKASKPDAIIKP